MKRGYSTAVLNCIFLWLGVPIKPATVCVCQCTYSYKSHLLIGNTSYILNKVLDLVCYKSFITFYIAYYVDFGDLRQMSFYSILKHLYIFFLLIHFNLNLKALQVMWDAN